MIGLEMMLTCAPNVAPETLTAIIQVESGGNPYAIGVNGPVKLPRKPSNAQEAARMAKAYIRAGYSVDLGLMQVNSRNLSALGYSVEAMFDPCTNLKAGARILERGYTGAIKRYGPGQTALQAALSAYNTGNYEAGFRNGYVAKYYKLPNATVKVTQPSPTMNTAGLPLDPLNPEPYSADTTVYVLERSRYESTAANGVTQPE